MKDVAFRHGRTSIVLHLPDTAQVYSSRYPASPSGPAGTVGRAVRTPIGSPPLGESLARRRQGNVVIVVSDATRPIPYAEFLPPLLADLERAGIPRGEMIILVATGMHRPSTPAERMEMFGSAVAGGYRIVDHRADDEGNLVSLPGPSASGARIKLNQLYVEAGFRLVTGLVEPHFMAGFSGGRKAICPGLTSLDTVRKFHSAAFLADARTANAVLEGNLLHAEALSVARLAPPDFTLNLVLDPERRVAGAFAGALEPAHEAACAFVRECACRPVASPADLVITSSGGYPLDATFYQCVKGFVSCLPAVKSGGTIVSFGSCTEGVGSAEYAGLMKEWSGRWRGFLAHIREGGSFTRDQWQFQMHARALEKIGEAGLHFVTDGLPGRALRSLSVTGHLAAPGKAGEETQRLVDRLVAGSSSVAAFPEGPYCVPTGKNSSAQ